MAQRVATPNIKAALSLQKTYNPDIELGFGRVEMVVRDGYVPVAALHAVMGRRAGNKVQLTFHTTVHWQALGHYCLWRWLD